MDSLNSTIRVQDLVKPENPTVEWAPASPQYMRTYVRQFYPHALFLGVSQLYHWYNKYAPGELANMLPGKKEYPTFLNRIRSLLIDGRIRKTLIDEINSSGYLMIAGGWTNRKTPILYGVSNAMESALEKNLHRCLAISVSEIYRKYLKDTNVDVLWQTFYVNAVKELQKIQEERMHSEQPLYLADLNLRVVDIGPKYQLIVEVQ
jgi:hypothetical protein